MAATTRLADQPPSREEHERLGEDPRVEREDGRLLWGTSRSRELVLRSGKHAAAGSPHYRVLDPRDEALDAFVFAGGPYRRDAAVASGAAAEVSSGVATLHIDLALLWTA